MRYFANRQAHGYANTEAGGEKQKIDQPQENQKVGTSNTTI